MCGIIAAFSTTVKNGKKNETNAFKVNDMIVNQYQDQFERGQRGFGIIRIDKKKKIELDRACEPTKFLLDLYMKPSEMIIAHHRTPTSTDNKIDQTHPMFVSNKSLQYDYYVVHNGMISNDTELYDKHIELGFKYTTEYSEDYGYQGSYKKKKFNDSEALAIELALFIENKVEAVGTENAAAFIILQVNKKSNIAEKVFFGRNGYSSVLNMLKEKGKMMISSKGEGDEVPVNILWSFKLNDPLMELDSKKIEFKKPYKAPVETVKTAIHSKGCTCVDCVDPVGFHQARQSLLPTTQTINSTSTNGKTEKTKDVEVEIETIRAWVDQDEAIEEAGYEDVVFTDKNYKETACEEFRFKIKNEDSRGITSVIDDALDEELERITDIMESYKKMLNQNTVNIATRNFYIAQVAIITHTMAALADIAEEDYTEKKLIEEEEEKQAEIDAAQNNFDWNNHIHSRGRFAGRPNDPNYQDYEDD